MTKRNTRNISRRGKNTAASPSNRLVLFGHHAVTAALRNPSRRIDRLMATRQAALRLVEILPEAAPEIVGRDEIENLLEAGAVHQGLALVTRPLDRPDLGEILAGAGKSATLLVLDQVTDPRNVGAVLRAAAAFGAAGLVVQDRHAPPATGALAKTASGALESVPLIRVTNLARALGEMKRHDFWCVGLDDAGEAALDAAADGDRVALVLGAEDSGLRRLTRGECDVVARLPTEDAFATLNVSTAAAVALYERRRQLKTRTGG
jgi:23S rRNA (guanosine2251-2'-O)-methyltransferase